MADIYHSEISQGIWDLATSDMRNEIEIIPRNAMANLNIVNTVFKGHNLRMAKYLAVFCDIFHINYNK